MAASDPGAAGEQAWIQRGGCHRDTEPTVNTFPSSKYQAGSAQVKQTLCQRGGGLPQNSTPNLHASALRWTEFPKPETKVLGGWGAETVLREAAHGSCSFSTLCLCGTWDLVPHKWLKFDLTLRLR